MTIARAIAAMRSGRWNDLTRTEWLDTADAIEPLPGLVSFWQTTAEHQAESLETARNGSVSEGHSADYWRKRAYDQRDEINALREAAKLAPAAPDSIREAVIALLEERRFVATNLKANTGWEPATSAAEWQRHLSAVGNR